MLSSPQISQRRHPGVVSSWHQWHPAGVHQGQRLPEVQRGKLSPAQWYSVQHGLRQLQYYMVSSNTHSLSLPACFLLRHTDTEEQWPSIHSVLFLFLLFIVFLPGSGSASTGSLSKCSTPHACPASSRCPASLSTSFSTLSSLRCCSWTSTGFWWGRTQVHEYRRSEGLSGRSNVLPPPPSSPPSSSWFSSWRCWRWRRWMMSGSMKKKTSTRQRLVRAMTLRQKTVMLGITTLHRGEQHLHHIQ